MGLLEKAGKIKEGSGEKDTDSPSGPQAESSQSSATGLMQRASQARDTSDPAFPTDSSAHQSSRDRAEAGQQTGTSTTEQLRQSSESGLLHRAEQARQSSESGPSGLMERAERARSSDSSSGVHQSASTGSRTSAGSGSGLLNRALFMRESMKGLLARASAMRDSEGAGSTVPAAPAESPATGLQGSPFAPGPESDSDHRESRPSSDALEPAGIANAGDELLSADSDILLTDDVDDSQDSIVPDTDLDEAVEFMDEQEFQEIAQEAEAGGDFDQDFFEPEISSEAMDDFQSPFDMAALEEEGSEDAASLSDAPGGGPDREGLDGVGLSEDSEMHTGPESEQGLERSEPDSGLATEQSESDSQSDARQNLDSEDEFPDLDLEYRMPDESEDPARPQSEESNDLDDPFSNWEQEALEQAEQEAHGLQAAPVPGRDESFLYEDTHPMTTLPAEAHIASQRKIDHYMALFDLLRELQDVDELEEFWDSLSYAILGQLGSNRVVIFAPHESGKNQLMYPAAFLGVTPPDEWVLKPGDEIYDTLQKSPEIHYAQEFQKATSTISDLEKEILDSINAQIVAPIGQPGHNAGMIVIGPNMEGVDYTLDDLEYLRLLGEMSAGALDRIRQRMKREEQSEQNEARLDLYERILSASREASQVKNLDDVYDVLLSHLKDDFSVESASLVLLNVPDQRYKIFAGNEISPESLEKFQLPVSSDLIGTISNLTRLYDFTDFRENNEITSCYSNDDLALMQNYWIVPLINLNWLVGFLTIHRTGRPWTEFDRELVLATSEFFAPILANCIILGERETLFRDPFSPVMERLRSELGRGAQFQTPVSLVEVRVKNLKRLLSLNEPDSVTTFLQDMSRSLGGLLFDTDFQARVGQGRFALILPGRSSQEAEIFIRKVQAELKRLNLLSSSPIDVQYSFQSVSSPDDARDAEKMLAFLDP